MARNIRIFKNSPPSRVVVPRRVVHIYVRVCIQLPVRRTWESLAGKTRSTYLYNVNALRPSDNILYDCAIYNTNETGGGKKTNANDIRIRFPRSFPLVFRPPSFYVPSGATKTMMRFFVFCFVVVVCEHFFVRNECSDDLVTFVTFR